MVRQGVPVQNNLRRSVDAQFQIHGACRSLRSIVPREVAKKIAPSRSVRTRDEAKCGYSNWTSVNDHPLMDARCVSDSGELSTRSSQNFGAIESGLRSVARWRAWSQSRLSFC